MGNKGGFDIERHVLMWKLEPKRKENVAYVLQLLEEVFGAATRESKAVPEKSQLDLERRKGARLKRGEDDVLRQRGGGFEC